jgi:hypothetical protein
MIRQPLLINMGGVIIPAIGMKKFIPAMEVPGVFMLV